MKTTIPRPTILIVHSNRALGELLTAAVMTAGCQAVIAQDDEAAFQMMGKHSRFDLLLIECELPGVGAVVNAFQLTQPSFPMVVLADWTFAHELPAPFIVLRMPFTVATLQRTIHEAFQQSFQAANRKEACDV